MSKEEVPSPRIEFANYLHYFQNLDAKIIYSVKFFFFYLDCLSAVKNRQHGLACGDAVDEVSTWEP